MSDRSRRKESPAANAADTMVREKPLERKGSKYGSGKMEGEGDARRKETEVANNNNKACTRRMVRAKTTRIVQQRVTSVTKTLRMMKNRKKKFLLGG